MKFENFAPYVSKDELISCGTLFKESKKVREMKQLSAKFIERDFGKYGFTHRTQVSRDLSNSGFVLGNKI
ncbi:MULTISPECIES: hypothetical protein [Vibrio]|uniref:Uncharacterized protein n=2 Tax=Vibrio TaxID=662 RepID=A0A5B1C5B0_VIBCL|nr:MULTISPECIES: hypothetical protein [Vibrio]MCA2471432.1 hypothetical protein [Vibrio alginolyticus]MCS0330560.1 hypothetical protein [Vibrio diabolicus]HAT8517394.1 hypothetical protein [Vibrio vulnificus]EGQ8302154.1 hypothetical protein [Vibrio parahaemolyticus]EGQ8891385.1 hypothetical protein [Vibrio parahaemolyticus]